MGLGKGWAFNPKNQRVLARFSARTFRLAGCIRANGGHFCADGQSIAFKTRGEASMIEHVSRESCESNPAAVESLKLLLDYAIVEGTELHLPAFVMLLRMAKLELAKSGQREVHLGAGDSPSLCGADEPAGERVAS
jgi:hypothetical protein